MSMEGDAGASGVLKQIGCELLLLTNAAGSMDQILLRFTDAFRGYDQSDWCLSLIWSGRGPALCKHDQRLGSRNKPTD